MGKEESAPRRSIGPLTCLFEFRKEIVLQISRFYQNISTSSACPEILHRSLSKAAAPPPRSHDATSQGCQASHHQSVSQNRASNSGSSHLGLDSAAGARSAATNVLNLAVGLLRSAHCTPASGCWNTRAHLTAGRGGASRRCSAPLASAGTGGSSRADDRSLTTIVKCDRVDHIYLQPETGLGLYPNKVDPI
jgi:hypothetical protein